MSSTFCNLFDLNQKKILFDMYDDSHQSYTYDFSLPYFLIFTQSPAIELFLSR